MACSARSTSDLGTFQEHLAFLAEVVRFGANLESILPSEVCRIARTKAQRDARRARNAEFDNRWHIENLVKANSKGMRAGHVRRIEAGLSEADFAPVTVVFRTPTANTSTEPPATTRGRSTSRAWHEAFRGEGGSLPSSAC